VLSSPLRRPDRRSSASADGAATLAVRCLRLQAGTCADPCVEGCLVSVDGYLAVGWSPPQSHQQVTGRSACRGHRITGADEMVSIDIGELKPDRARHWSTGSWASPTVAEELGSDPDPIERSSRIPVAGQAQGVSDVAAVDLDLDCTQEHEIRDSAGPEPPEAFLVGVSLTDRCDVTGH